MSHLVTDFYSRIPNKGRTFTDEEAKELTAEQFDKLSLSDQMNLFESHRSVYDRLVNGRSADEEALHNLLHDEP